MRMFFVFTKNFVLVALFFIAGCRQSENQQINSTTMATSSEVRQATVDVMVFSGRPDPTWVLSEEELDGILALIEAFPKSGERSMPSKLGYGGFLIRLDIGEAGQLTTLHVFGDVIQRQLNGEAIYYLDSEKQVESELLRLSESHVDADLYAFLKEALNQQEEN